MKRVSFAVIFVFTAVVAYGYGPVYISSSQDPMTKKVIFQLNLEGEYLGQRLVNPVPEDRIVSLGAINFSKEAPPETVIVPFTPNSLNILSDFTPGIDDTLRMGFFTILDDNSVDWFNLWPSFHFFETNPPGGIFTDTLGGIYEIRLNYSFGWFVRVRKDTSDRASIAMCRLIAFGPTEMIIAEPGDSIIAVGGPYGWVPDSSVLRTAFSPQGCAIEKIQGDINKEFKGTLLLKRAGNYFWADLRRARTDPSGIIQNTQLQFNTESLPEGTALDGEAPDTATNFRVEGDTLRWNNPSVDFARVILRSSTTGYPDTSSEFVYSGTSSIWLNLKSGGTIYYGLWVLDEFSNLSYPVFVTVNDFAVVEKSNPNPIPMVFPNPTRGPIRISPTATVQIFDLTGRLIARFEKANSINCDFPTGSYILKAGKSIRKIIIVR